MDCVVKIAMLAPHDFEADAEHLFDVEFGRGVHLAVLKSLSRRLVSEYSDYRDLREEIWGFHGACATRCPAPYFHRKPLTLRAQAKCRLNLRA